MNLIERTVQNNTAVISRDIARSVKTLRQSPVFGKLLAAGCGTTIGKKADFDLFARMFQTAATKDYINDLIVLGDLLGDPGKKRQAKNSGVFPDRDHRLSLRVAKGPMAVPS